MTESFVANLGENPMECEAVTEDLKTEIDADIDWTGVKYVMSEEIFDKFAASFQRIQEVYNKLSDAAAENDITIDKLCNFMISRGIISKKELSSFYFA